MSLTKPEARLLGEEMKRTAFWAWLPVEDAFSLATLELGAEIYVPDLRDEGTMLAIISLLSEYHDTPRLTVFRKTVGLSLAGWYSSPINIEPQGDKPAALLALARAPRGGD